MLIWKRYSPDHKLSFQATKVVVVRKSAADRRTGSSPVLGTNKLLVDLN